MADNFHREEADKALESAVSLLDHARVRYRRVVEAGHAAETIVRYAREQNCDSIIMGSRGLSSVGNLVLGSIAARVVHLAEIPVTLVK
jgi:nucleotide-binding universal stress UspA family protein